MIMTEAPLDPRWPFAPAMRCPRDRANIIQGFEWRCVRCGAWCTCHELDSLGPTTTRFAANGGAVWAAQHRRDCSNDPT
jgi:hypothetical protein